MIKVSAAKELARAWVDSEASKLPGFAGAYLAGSITYMADDARFPTCSDVDIKVLIDGFEPPENLGKFVFADVILEVGYASLDDFKDPEKILADYHLAGAFRGPTAISDATGRLLELRQYVGARFAQRKWVLKRCEHARATVRYWLSGVGAAQDLHDKVTACHFAAGVTAHVILIAGLHNPTVRRRYAECAKVLEDCGRLDVHERMLRTLGAGSFNERQVLNCLAEVGKAFDFACSVIESPYRFAADMTEATRPIAIEGSLEMIEQGYHREAMFWILAIYSRCRAVVSADTSADTLADFDLGYWRLLGSLGIETLEDLGARAIRVQDDLDHVWEVAMSIVDANPDVGS